MSVARLMTLLAAVALGGCARSQRAEPVAGVQLNWQPSWPGTQMAVMKGEPYVGGDWTFRFRMPAGYWIHPHRHRVDARILVISGAFLVGHGEALDSTRVRSLNPGQTITLERGTAHFEGTRGETVIEVSGTGIWGITFVDPDRDPARR